MRAFMFTVPLDACRIESMGVRQALRFPAIEGYLMKLVFGSLSVAAAMVRLSSSLICTCACCYDVIYEAQDGKMMCSHANSLILSHPAVCPFFNMYIST